MRPLFRLLLLSLLTLQPLVLRAAEGDPAPAPSPAAEDGAASPADADKAAKMRQLQQEIATEQARVESIVKDFHYSEGSVQVPGGMATLNLPAGYRYLGQEDAKKVVVDLWRNPHSSATDVLGLVVPKGQDLRELGAWAIVVSFDKQGYVSDKDADKIDYDDLLKHLQEGIKQGNERRVREGGDRLTLVGWALSPHYDKEHRVLYWAQEIHGDSEPAGQDGLNYDVRVLGRHGVLSLNALSSMRRLHEVDTATPEIASIASFNEGERYADFNEKTDKVSTIGLAGLIAGGGFVAAKAGLFKGIWVALVAAKKVVIAGCVAVGAWFKKLFGKKDAAA